MVPSVDARRHMIEKLRGIRMSFTTRASSSPEFFEEAHRQLQLADGSYWEMVTDMKE